MDNDLDFGFLEESAVTPELSSPLVQLAEGEIDPRYMKTSYSSLLDLHACPRLYQLNKLGAESTIDFDSSVTFAFGHAVGDGIASYFIHRDLDKTVFDMFLGWSPDLFAENEKQKKSFWAAVFAIQKLDALVKEGMLADFEVATYNGKPAAELSFKIQLPFGFSYRGYMDLVLRRVTDGETAVLECKTNSANWVNHVQYKNSAQGVSYSVILDKIAEDIVSYSVEYLIYMSRLERFENFAFPKSYHQRALMLRDIVYDVETIQTYVKQEGNYGIWPMRGESCSRFGKPCQFLDICQFPTERLMSPLREIHYEDKSRNEGETDYQFVLTLEELLASQPSESTEVLESVL